MRKSSKKSMKNKKGNNMNNNGNKMNKNGKNGKNMTNNKEQVKMTKKMPKVKFSKNPSFAAKLGAFLLQGVKDDVIFSASGGFSAKQAAVVGALPYFHMNINEKQFRDMLKSAKKVNSESLAGVCNKADLNNILSAVDFKCNDQASSAIVTLQQSLIDSINNRWSIRKNGQKRLKQILEKMTWQVQNDIIPKSSIVWGK